MNLKLNVGAALLLAALVFSVQNAGAVEVQILVWKFSLSLAVIIFATLAAGLITGWAVTSRLQRKSKVPKSFAPPGEHPSTALSNIPPRLTPPTQGCTP